MKVPVQNNKNSKRADSKQEVNEKVEVNEKDHSTNLEETPINITKKPAEKHIVSNADVKK